MNGKEKTVEELKKDIEVLEKTIEIQKRTINTLINQYVLGNKKEKEN